MQLNNPVTECEADPRPWNLIFIVQARKQSEDALMLVLWDAQTVIFDPDTDHSRRYVRWAYRDLASVVRVSVLV